MYAAQDCFATLHPYFSSRFSTILSKMAYGNKRGKVGQEKGAIDKNFVFGLEPGLQGLKRTAATYLATNRRFVNVVVLTLAYMGRDAWVVFVEGRLGTNYVGMGGSKIEGGGVGDPLEGSLPSAHAVPWLLGHSHKALGSRSMVPGILSPVVAAGARVPQSIRP